MSIARLFSLRGGIEVVHLVPMLMRCLVRSVRVQRRLVLPPVQDLERQGGTARRSEKKGESFSHPRILFRCKPTQCPRTSTAWQPARPAGAATASASTGAGGGGGGGGSSPRGAAFVQGAPLYYRLSRAAVSRAEPHCVGPTILVTELR